MTVKINAPQNGPICSTLCVNPESWVCNGLVTVQGKPISCTYKFAIMAIAIPLSIHSRHGTVCRFFLSVVGDSGIYYSEFMFESHSKFLLIMYQRWPARVPASNARTLCIHMVSKFHFRLYTNTCRN